MPTKAEVRGKLAKESALKMAENYLIPTIVRGEVEKTVYGVESARRSYRNDLLAKDVARANINDGYDKLEHEKKLRVKELEAKDLEILKTMVEIALLKAKTDEARIRIDLIKKVIEEVDFGKISDSLKTYIITTLAHPNTSTAYNEFEMQGLLKDIIIEERQADKDKKKYESEIQAQKVAREKAAADVERAAAEETIKSYQNIKGSF